MPKLLARIVTVLLSFCLALNPALAQAPFVFSSGHRMILIAFEKEAFAARALEYLDVITGPRGVKAGVSMQAAGLITIAGTALWIRAVTLSWTAFQGIDLPIIPGTAFISTSHLMSPPIAEIIITLSTALMILGAFGPNDDKLRHAEDKTLRQKIVSFVAEAGAAFAEEKIPMRDLRSLVRSSLQNEKDVDTWVEYRESLARMTDQEVADEWERLQKEYPKELSFIPENSRSFLGWAQKPSQAAEALERLRLKFVFIKEYPPNAVAAVRGIATVIAEVYERGTRLEEQFLAPGRRPLQIIIADDELKERERRIEVLEQLLAERKIGAFDSFQAPNGWSALALYKEAIAFDRPSDLLLTDGFMPGHDGYDLAQSIRRFEKQTLKRVLPIILISMHPDEDHATMVGINAFLTKDNDPTMLKGLIVKELKSAPLSESFEDECSFALIFGVGGSALSFWSGATFLAAILALGLYKDVILNSGWRREMPKNAWRRVIESVLRAIPDSSHLRRHLTDALQQINSFTGAQNAETAPSYSSEYFVQWLSSKQGKQMHVAGDIRLESGQSTRSVLFAGSGRGQELLNTRNHASIGGSGILIGIDIRYGRDDVVAVAKETISGLHNIILLQGALETLPRDLQFDEIRLMGPDPILVSPSYPQYGDKKGDAAARVEAWAHQLAIRLAPGGTLFVFTKVKIKFLGAFLNEIFVEGLTDILSQHLLNHEIPDLLRRLIQKTSLHHTSLTIISAKKRTQWIVSENERDG
jgi:CheY-like chemotaxis protein